ncbi:MAG: two-component regulator propeller domain-containing protein [Balneola sp.]
MRNTIYVVLFFLCSTSDLAAQSLLDWKSYTSFRSVSDITEDLEGRTWMTTEGGILISKDSEIIKTLTTIDGLSRLDGSAIIYSQDLEAVFVGYITGEIDVININDFKVDKLTDIERNSSFSQKGINDFIIIDNSLLVATEFGLVEYSLEGLFVKDSYIKFGLFNTAIPVNLIVEDSGILYLGTNEGIAFTNQDGNFSSSNWQNYNESNGFSSSPTIALAVFGEQIYASTIDENYKLSDDSWNINTDFGDELIVDYRSNNNTIVALSEKNIFYKRGLQTFVSSSLFVNIGTIISGASISDRVLFGTRNKGMGILDISSNTVSYDTPEGPFINFFEGMSFDNGILISGSTKSSSRKEELDKTRGFYIFKDGEWENYNEIITPEFENVVYRQAFKTTVTKNYYYFGSWGTGVVRFNKETGDIVIFDETNTTLRGWPEGGELFPVISGLETDSNDDVWIVSRYADTPLYRQTPGDEDWQAFDENSAATSSDLYENLFIDSFDQKWVALQNAQSSGTGLLIIDTKNPEDGNDDIGVKLRSESNNGNLPDNKINVIIEDNNGEVWIGTSRGIAKFVFPELIVEGSSQERTAQWLINEDTSAVSRFLLRDINATAMAVNSANEKWIGSANQGLYLLNAEGSRILKRFTVENSPLFSNGIKSIAINDLTGEVFISTDVGLIGYQDIPKQPVSEMKKLKVFPNPFNYSEDEHVVIDGLSNETNVKILGVDGTVVNTFSTNGGRVSWDGRDSSGNMLGSGVYFVVAVDIEGSSKGVGKVVIVR